ncbi:alkaline phosphatase family protein [Flavilitoribacter nigricans]|uniref:Phosphoesterase n=1 Tax=Flavilitoribacter nigricans (strain ATCC 23147 / DSM 23189 / NBRC 102662 / NCIMB 1420 / SS-2) TaxID=1122177 RepID=A0A2D0N5E1_FLAN2|nr:alkaline phosphatase family protein [Flavilitoribacter nigricans]PHN03657.1 phosphoesterase [Flavilitoribacter nigricans DSM 23189 = NBRC 102662]
MSQYLKPQPRQLQEKINHIVVVMLENRSFDNLLGWLYSDRTPNNKQEFEGLNWNLWNPLNNIDSDGIPFIEKVPVEMNGQKKKRYGKPVPNPTNFCLPDPDPGEGFLDTNDQLFSSYQVAQQYTPEPTNMGFVNNYQKAMLYGSYSFGDDPTNPRNIMKCFTPEQTPVLSELAWSFAVCDHYHASVPSQTLPNRAFVHAATSDGSVNNTPTPFTTSKTIYNQIQDAIDGGRTELSWGIFGNNPLPSSGKKREDDLPGKFGDDHFSLTRLCMTQLHDTRFDQNFGTIDDFLKRCKKGTLPSYSFIEPTYGGPDQNDQHPPADIRPGEKLMADLYNAIKKSPKFNETLFIITYDEHGGCYDHVPPPGGASNPDAANTAGQHGFQFNRFGVRVPCVVVNPHIPAGLIARPSGYIPYDHTSIIKTVQNCFRLKGYLTQRDKNAPDLSGLLLLDTPRQKDIPRVKPLKWNTTIDEDHINDLHRIIVTIVEALTGKKKADSADFMEFIQKNYNRLFPGAVASGKKAKKKKKLKLTTKVK